MSFTAALPPGVEPAALARLIVDTAQRVERRGTGERYPARAEVLIPPPSERPVPSVAEDAADGRPRKAVTLLLWCWAARRWSGGEASAVLADFHCAASTAIDRAWPGGPSWSPLSLPADPAFVGAAGRSGVLITSAGRTRPAGAPHPA